MAVTGLSAGATANKGQTTVALRGGSVGIASSSGRELIARVREGLPYTAITILEKESGLSLETIAEVIRIPLRTLARRKKAGRLDVHESERLLRLGLIFEQTLDLFDGDRAAAERWLLSPAKALGNECPLMHTQTEVGAREVENLIGRLEHGVFS